MSQPPTTPFTAAASCPAGAVGGKGKVPPHYACLDVHPSISDHELTRQYKRLSLQLHPDRAAYRGNPANEANVRERFQAITAAYNVLSDPEKRAAYDTQHGVNFRNRVEHLQGRLEQGICHRGDPSREAKPDIALATGTLKRSKLEATSPSHLGDTDDDDDDEDDDDEAYVPEHHSPTAGDEGKQGTRRFFSLYPRQNAGGHTGGTGVRMSTLKQVTLYPKGPVGPEVEVTNQAQRSSPRALAHYGIVVHRNRLVSAEAADVPFPALIMIVNGTAVDPEDDVAGLIERHWAAAEAQRRRHRDQAVEVHRDEDAPHEEQGEEADETAAVSSCGDGALELTLCYATDAFDLVGDTTLLGADSTLSDLLSPHEELHRRSSSSDDSTVAEDVAAAVLPSLLPGACVVAVNGVVVDSRRDLRQRLRELAGPPRTTGGDLGTACGEVGPHGSRRPRGIWLEVATVDGLDDR